MRANPGGTITGAAIIGRDQEISEIWNKIQTRSVLLSAERRVGKTSLLRKMKDHPPKGWTPLLVVVESARHPIDCVESIYEQATNEQLRTSKSVWLKRIQKSYEKLASAQVAGWKLPQIQADWRSLLRSLIENIEENSETGVLIMIDEFPLMIWNIADDHGHALAMQFLDALRELRQQFESTGKLRFILAGSIGFHLVLQHLKLAHDYKGAPTNDMHPYVLTGMSVADTELMCRMYLDEEKIRRDTPADVAERMYYRTDGLPLYIQVVCEVLQENKATVVTGDDVDRILNDFLNRGNVSWFRDAAQRIDSYYAKFRSDKLAMAILNRLSREEEFTPESVVIDAVYAVQADADDTQVKRAIELLRDDNYLVRDVSSGERRYRFRYRLMREWWQINRA